MTLIWIMTTLTLFSSLEPDNNKHTLELTDCTKHTWIIRVGASPFGRRILLQLVFLLTCNMPADLDPGNSASLPPADGTSLKLQIRWQYDSAVHGHMLRIS